MAEGKRSNSRLYALLLLALLAVVSILYFISAPVYLYIVAYMWFGFAIGALMQHGRFCYASSWRDLIAIKVPRMMVGVVVATMVLSIVGVASFALYPGRYVFPQLGLGLVVGGVIFGLGMVLAGGCGSGVLYKSGEGHLSAMVALVFLAISQAVVAATIFDPINKVLNTPSLKPMSQMIFGGDGAGQSYGFWQHIFADTIISGILVGLLLLIGVYVFAIRKVFMKKRVRELSAATATTDGGSIKTGLKDDLAGFWSMITGNRRTLIIAIAIGAVVGSQLFVTGWMANKFDFNNFGQVLAGKTSSGAPAPDSWPDQTYPDEVSEKGTVFDTGYWVMATQIMMAVGWGADKLGIDMNHVQSYASYPGLPSPWHSPLLLLSLGLLLGSATMALFSREFKWKPLTKENFVYAMIGGSLMGLGARIGFGCNIGAFFTRAAFGHVGGWVYFLGMGVGAFAATKFVTYMSERKMKDMDFDIDIEL